MNAIAQIWRRLFGRISRPAGVQTSRPWPRRVPEPVWVIHSEDPIGSGIVRRWCELAKASGVDKAKVDGALAIAGHMDAMTPGVCFTLRGQDMLAMTCVALWIHRAKNGRGNSQLIQQAQDVLERMQTYQPRKLPD